MNFVFKILSLILEVYSYAILAYLILNMLMPTHKITEFLKSVSEPVLQPVRKLCYKYFPSLYKLPIDISPLILFFGISLMQNLLNYFVR